MTNSTWVEKGSECVECGCMIIITQPDHENHPYDDYWWYCSNKKCKHHDGEHTGDMEVPDWVKEVTGE